MTAVAVFDTNILFSAVAWRGKPAECLALARNGAIEGVTCTEILNELAEKLRLRLDFSSNQTLGVLGSMLSFLRPVTITGRMKGLSADPKDDMVLECAIAAQASHVISGDKKHLLILKQFRGIPIVSPSDFLKLTQT